MLPGGDPLNSRFDDLVSLMRVRFQSGELHESRLINASNRRRSESLTAVNFSPRPLFGNAWRIAASALMCPSSERKSSLVLKPTVPFVDVSMKIPPMPMLRIRENSSRPLHSQQTQTSSRVSTLLFNLRKYLGVSCVNATPPPC
jgi:hypothetical protein